MSDFRLESPENFQRSTQSLRLKLFRRLTRQIERLSRPTFEFLERLLESTEFRRGQTVNEVPNASYHKRAFAKESNGERQSSSMWR